MGVQSFIGFMISVFGVIILMPGFEELTKVFVITVVIIVTIVINLLFQWERTKELIVNKVTAEVMLKMNNRMFLKDFAKILRDALREEKNEAHKK